MNPLRPIPIDPIDSTDTRRPAQPPDSRGSGRFAPLPAQTQRVLRNTYALLAMTLLFSAFVATLATTLALPSPGLMLTLVGMFGLLFAVHKLSHSGWALPAVFAFTGFMGYTLGPLLASVLARSGGGATIALALGATGATFLALSALVLVTRRDFGIKGGFLLIGMVVAIVLGLAAVLFQIPALALAVAAMVALLSAALMLYETSRIVNGGETNYVLATVGLYLSVFNLFSSLLTLFGVGGDE